MRVTFATLTRLALVVIIALASGAAGCRKKPSQAQCLSTCQQRGQELKCYHGDKCQEECADLHARTVCRDELDAFEACFLKEPAERWHCEDDGKPAPQGNVCLPQRKAVETCLEQALNGPNKPQKL